MVLTRAGRATHFTLQVRVQRKPNAGRRHPIHPLTDRPTGHPMTAGHHHCRLRWMTTQAGPLQHRPRASLQRTQHPPRQLRHRIRHRPRGQRQPIPDDDHPRHAARLPSVLSTRCRPGRGQPASGWGAVGGDGAGPGAVLAGHPVRAGGDQPRRPVQGRRRGPPLQHRRHRVHYLAAPVGVQSGGDLAVERPRTRLERTRQELTATGGRAPRPVLSSG